MLGCSFLPHRDIFFSIVTIQPPTQGKSFENFTAAITDYGKLEHLRQQKFSVSQFLDLEVWNQGVGQDRLHPDPPGRILSCCQDDWASFRSVVPISYAFPSLHYSPSVRVVSSALRIPVSGFGAHLKNPGLSPLNIFNVIKSAKIFFFS